MQTLLTVIVLLALVALGILFLMRVNAQTTGRPVHHHRHPSPYPSFRLWSHKRPHSDTTHAGSPEAGPPPPTPKAGDDL